jgi:plasmid stability protein
MLAGARYTDSMATLTIRNVDETVKRRLQVRAALNGRSMEAEAREVLSAAVEEGPAAIEPKEGLGSAIHKLFAPLARISHGQSCFAGSRRKKNSGKVLFSVA